MAAANFPLSVSLGAIDRLTAPLARVQARINRIFAPVQALNARTRVLAKTSGIGDLWVGFNRVGRSIGGVGHEVFALGRRIGVLGALGVGVASGLILSYSSAGDSIAKTAAKIGIGVEALQELRFAGERAGVAPEKLDKSMALFARTVGDAALGTGEGIVAFKALGISVTDAEGRMRPAEEIFHEVADRLHSVTDQSLRAALAAKLFGRDGVTMTNMLRGGSRELRDMAAEARRLGLVMSEEAARDAEAFDDSLTDMKASLLGVRNTIGAQLLPILQPLLARFTEFVVRVRPQIEAFAQRFMAELPGRIQAVRDWLARLHKRFEPLLALGQKILDRFGPVNVLFTLLAVAMGAKLIVAIGALVTAFGVLGKAMLLTPIGLILTGLALLATGAYFLVQHWDKVKARFFGTTAGIKESILGLVDWAHAHLPAFAGQAEIVRKAWAPVRWFFKKMASGVVQILEWLRDSTLRLVAEITHPIETVTKAWKGLVGEGSPLSFKPGGISMPATPEQRRRGRPLVGPGGFTERLRELSAQALRVEQPAPASGGASLDSLNLSGLRDALGAVREARVRVDFENLPKGARPRIVSDDGVDLDMRAGWAMQP